MKSRAEEAAAVAALACAPAAGAWTWPSGGAVLQPFVFDPVDPYAGGQHRGIDVGGESGSPVLAPAGGTVSFAGSVPTSGKSVTIQTSDGLSMPRAPRVDRRHAQYGRLRGLCRGTIGPSGTAEVGEPYVHLGVRVSARDHGYLDPLAFLPARPSPTPPVPERLAPETAEVPAAPDASAPEAPAAAGSESPALLQIEEGANPLITEPHTETLNPAQIRCWPKRPRPRLCPSTDPLRRSGSLSRRPRNCRPKRLCHRRPRRPAVVTWRLPQTLGRWSDRLRKNRVRNRPVRNRGRPRAKRRPPIVPKQAACQPSGLGRSRTRLPRYRLSRAPQRRRTSDRRRWSGCRGHRYGPEEAAGAARAVSRNVDAAERRRYRGRTHAGEQLAVKPASSASREGRGDPVRRVDHERSDAGTVVAGGHAGGSFAGKLSVAAAVLLALLALAGGGLALAGRRRPPQPTSPPLRAVSPAPTNSAAIAVEVLTEEAGTSSAPVPLRCERVRINRITTGQNPRRRRVAVCGRTASHRSCGRLRPVRRLRPVSPSARKRRADGVRHRRARHAGDGGRRSGTAIAA